MGRIVKNKNNLKSQKRGLDFEKKTRDDEVNIHHIVPRSRGGDENRTNKTIVSKYYHEKYHDLFKNMTPPEILAFLETYFWKGQEKWVNDYCFQRGPFELGI